MQRRDFLSQFGFTVALACTGCLAACSKSSSSPSPNPGGNNDDIPFNIDLGTSLQSIGASIIQAGVIVVRVGAENDNSSFIAVQSACTHQGTTIAFNSSLDHFKCPNHGSEFAQDGNVLVGPASRALKKYKVELDGNTLTIKQ